MLNLFDILPSGFFNCLASVSNNRIYSDCLKIIYEQYDKEISYRISRDKIKDALANYLLENNINQIDENTDVNYSELASAIIRKFCSSEIGWLEEDSDNETYEKHIIMSEQGILLAEFLNALRKPEREEFSSYILNIYNILTNEKQWSDNPYVNGLKNVYRNVKALSKALKRLSTSIKKIIEQMMNETSLESLTDNMISYFEGDFIKEYSRLAKQQNIHLYRSHIKNKLDMMENNTDLFDLIIEKCMEEEKISKNSANELVLDMLYSTRAFISNDYDRIMKDIKQKINLYINIAIGRARFLRNRDADDRGSIETVIGYLTKADLKADAPNLFLLEQNQFIDTNSLRFPHKQKVIKTETYAELEEITEEDIKNAQFAYKKEAYNPYSKDKMKLYLENIMGNNKIIDSDDLPLASKEDMLCALSVAAYGGENGYEITLLDDYTSNDDLKLHKFQIKRIEK